MYACAELQFKRLTKSATFATRYGPEEEDFLCTC